MSPDTASPPELMGQYPPQSPHATQSPLMFAPQKSSEIWERLHYNESLGFRYISCSREIHKPSHQKRLRICKTALASSETELKAETKKRAIGQKFEACIRVVLSKAFARFPTFNMAKVIRDKRTGKTKGFGLQNIRILSIHGFFFFSQLYEILFTVCKSRGDGDISRRVLKETDFSCSDGIKPKTRKQLGGKLGTSLQTDLGIDTAVEMRAAWSWFGAALGDRTSGLNACESGDGIVEGLGSAKPREIRSS